MGSKLVPGVFGMGSKLVPGVFGMGSKLVPGVFGMGVFGMGVLGLALFLLTTNVAHAAPDSIDARRATAESSIGELWQARGPKASRKAVAAIEALDLDFPTLYGVLSQGPSYSSAVRTGRRVFTRGRDFHYIVWIPESYDPRKRYPVRFYLHGGVGRPVWSRNGTWWGNEDKVRSEDHLVVLPASWQDAMWWQRRQVENLEEILRRLIADYNVDENRIHMIGVSDGATGAWFHAFRKPMRWASFVSLIGHPKVLSNPRLSVDGELFAANLRNRPFFVVNGGRDRLYPVLSILPYLELFHDDGTEIYFRPQPEGGHDLRFWPKEAEAIESFIKTHPRDPLPDQLSWETEDTERYGRLHWLQILELGETASDVDLIDANHITRPPLGPTLGAQVAEQGEPDGVRIRHVQPGSVAQKAGLLGGDVILRIEDAPTTTVEQLATALHERAISGQSLPITIRRGDDRQTVALRFPEASTTPTHEQAFPRRKPAGRVDLARNGNHIDVQTRGVRAFRLLLSPDELDFDREIVVTVNGVELVRQRVQLDPNVLLRWADRDRDRTQLFGAELDLEVPRSNAP